MRGAILFLCAAAVLCVNAEVGKAESLAIQKGSKVAFEYMLTVDGKVVENSYGKPPLEFTQGDEKVIPGLARQIEGMRAGEEKTIIVSPEEAYGAPNPAAIKEVPLSSFPSGMRLKEGMLLQANDAGGNVFPAKVVRVKKDTAVIDFNHPLVGKTLTFNIKIVSVK